MSQRQKLTPKRIEAFLEALRAIPNVSRACKLAGISRPVMYEAKAADPTLADEWDDAIDQGIEAMEAEAMRRAIEGIDKPVFYQGDEVALLREYSDTLMIFLLKAHRPEKYQDRLKQEISGADGGAIPITFIDYRKDLGTGQESDENVPHAE